MDALEKLGLCIVAAIATLLAVLMFTAMLIALGFILVWGMPAHVLNKLWASKDKPEE